MGVRIEKDGWSIEGSTLEELRIGVAAVQQALASIQEPKRGRPRKSNGALASEGREKDIKNLNAVRSFVAALQDSGSGGMRGNDLAKRMKLSSAKALSNIQRVARNVLKDLGIEPSQVFEHVMGDDYKKIWKPKERTGDAAKAIQSRLSELE